MCGVKGATVLALHPTFNIVHGVVVDDLHGLFLGVTLTLLHLWLDRKSRNKPFFIGNKVLYEVHNTSSPCWFCMVMAGENIYGVMRMGCKGAWLRVM